MHDDIYRDRQKVEMIKLMAWLVKWALIFSVPYLLGRIS